MTLSANAKSIAFSKIINSILNHMQFAIFMTITWSAFALTNFEKRIQNDKKNDQILIARCEAKCWNQLSEQNKCTKNCMTEWWNKPGICPEKISNASIEGVYQPNNFCKNDMDCIGVEKCCQQHNSSNCRIPTKLEKITGLPTIPVIIIVSVNKSNIENGVQITLEWTSDEYIKQTGQILYIIERRYVTGKHFLEEKFSHWKMIHQHTSLNKVEIKNINKPERWFQFRVVAVNENGTRGPSNPSKTVFSFERPKVPNSLQSLKVGAKSWGNGKFHVQLVWEQPESEVKIMAYKIAWSSLTNLTLVPHHSTSPWDTTKFWLHDIKPNTEYFVQVQAVAQFGSKKLYSKKSSIVFSTANYTKTTRYFRPKRKEHYEIISKRKIKDFLIGNPYWWQNELLANITWKPVVNLQTNYSISWSHYSCCEENGAQYVAKTDMNNLLIYGLYPDCRYKVSIRAVRNQTLFAAKQTFSTFGCENNRTISNYEIIICPFLT